MTVSALLDPARITVQQIFESRAAADDDVSWELNLTPSFFPGECDEHPEMEMAVAFYARLLCPETTMASTAHLLLPLSRCMEVEDVEEWVNDIWDRLVMARIAEAAGLSEPSAGTA